MVAIFRIFIIKLFLLTAFSSYAFTAVSIGASRASCTRWSSSKLFIDASSTGGDIGGNSDGIDKSLSASELKRKLLSLIPIRPFDGPATNVTTPRDTCLVIEKLSASSKRSRPFHHSQIRRRHCRLSTGIGNWSTQTQARLQISQSYH